MFALSAAAFLFYACDMPESSSPASPGAPPPYKLTQDKGGTNFTLKIDEGVTIIKAGEYAAVASIGSGADKKILNTKIIRQTLGLKTDGEVRTAVTTIILPSTLETIEEYAFYGHSAVKGTLIIPDKVHTVQAHAFGGMGTDLTFDLKNDSKLSTIGAGAFDIAKIKTIRAPRYTLTKNADNTTYTLAVAEGVSTVAKGEFSTEASIGGAGGVPTITLNTRLKGALLGAEPQDAITAITLPSTLEAIEDYAFYSYSRVQGTLTIPKQVQRIDKHAFNYLGFSHRGESSLVLAFEKDSQCTIIEESAFQNSGITSLALPEQLETIKNFAFAFIKTTMSSFTIPEKVQNIGNGAFVLAEFSDNATLTINSPDLTTLGTQLFVVMPTDNVFTTVKLPQAVYDRFTTQAQLANRFGQVTAYQHLDGTPHAAKP